MKRITLNLDEATTEALVAQIDNSHPTLKDVAGRVLKQEGDRWHAVRDGPGDMRACQCNSPERAADDPETAVVFDAKTNEFHIVRETGRGSSHLIVRYCFFCGGKAPASKRARLFAWVSDEEKVRLASLCSEVRTFEDAIRAFGAPDSDLAAGEMSGGSDDAGRPRWTARRVITYNSLSETADVRFVQHVGDQVRVNFSYKYLGEAKAADRRDSLGTGFETPPQRAP
jgi:hypothetical protein